MFNFFKFRQRNSLPDRGEEERVVDTQQCEIQQPSCAIDSIKNTLGEAIPDKTEFTPPANATPDADSVQSKIAQDNATTEAILKNTQWAIVKSYTDQEDERAKRQKPLLVTIVVFTGVQLAIFNFIITYLVIVSLHNGCESAIENMFDIVKYYIGATVAQLIGMLVFITKGTFSSNHVRVMELILKDDKTKEK